MTVRVSAVSLILLLHSFVFSYAQNINLQPTTTILTSSLNPCNVGQAVTYAATVSGQNSGAPTGTVTFTISGNRPVVVPLSNGQAIFTWTYQYAGPRTVTASYSGDANDTSSTSASLSQAVNPLPATTTSLSPSLNPSMVYQPITYTATVSGQSGTPTGSVTFTINGNKPVVVPLSNGQAGFTWTYQYAGPRTVTAAYSGDGANQPSTSPALGQTVNPQTTQATFTSSHNPSQVNQAVTYTAAVSGQNGGVPTGTVTFTINGNKPVAVPLSNAQAIFTWTYQYAGPRTVTASYSGDANDTPSTAAPLNQTVNPLPASTTSLSSSLNPSRVYQPVTYTATVSGQSGTPTGSVTFTISGNKPVVVPLSNGQAGFTWTYQYAGPRTVTAAYSGDGANQPSTSAAVAQTVNAAPAVDVLTYHDDVARTGANLDEVILTPANVTSATFGKKADFPADGLVDAQPLYASNVAVPGNGTHNLLIAATEHDSVYAFDADSGSIIWQKSMLGSGETTSDVRSCDQVSPEIGITATPVIDRTRGPNGAIYLVAMSKNGSTYHQRLHALDLATGAELFRGPKDITATYPGTGDNSSGGNVIFDPAQYKERMGLLLLNGVVYTAWASHCDITPYTGWAMGFNADTLVQTTVLNLTPNGSEGAFWGSGAGIAADSQGNLYLLAGNGDFDTTLNASGFPASGDYGNGFLKLSTTGGQLAVADYFEMSDQQSENNGDVDLGSGGAMVLPDFTDSVGKVHQLVVGAGKDSNIYLLDRNNMGKFNAGGNNIYQQLTGVLGGGMWAVPAYFNNRVYYGPVGNSLLAFTVSNAKLSTSPTASSANVFSYPGTSPAVSANGTSNGIVWAVDNGGATLYAYDAATLSQLYNSNQASGNRDNFGAGNKFITPIIVNGKVFVGTPNSVAVFGLLP